MKAIPRERERPRLNALMILVLILREVQRDRSVCFAVYKLVHLRISARANFFGRALRDNRTVTEHYHARGDAKCTRHIVRDDDCRHVASTSQFERELVDNRRHDRVEPGRWLVAEKQFRIECECAGQSNALLHSATDFSRLEILK